MRLRSTRFRPAAAISASMRSGRTSGPRLAGTISARTMARSHPTRTSAGSGTPRKDDIRASHPTASSTVVFPWALPPTKTVMPGPTSTSDAS